MRKIDMDKALELVGEAEKYIYGQENLSPLAMRAANELIGNLKRVLYKLLEVCEIKEG